jgi:hypothetical protein
MRAVLGEPGSVRPPTDTAETEPADQVVDAIGSVDNGSSVLRPEAAAYREEMTLTVFGVVVLTFMMLMYALEGRGPRFILAFALGCGLSSAYGFLSGAWPFGVVEAIWTVIALHRYRQATTRPAGGT